MEHSVSFSLVSILVAVETLLVGGAAFFIRLWINSVNDRAEQAESSLSSVDARVRSLEASVVHRDDLQRLEDRLDTKLERHDAKLDRVIALLIRGAKSDEKADGA